MKNTWLIYVSTRTLIKQVNVTKIVPLCHFLRNYSTWSGKSSNLDDNLFWHKVQRVSVHQWFMSSKTSTLRQPGHSPCVTYGIVTSQKHFPQAVFKEAICYKSWFQTLSQRWASTRRVEDAIPNVINAASVHIFVLWAFVANLEHTILLFNTDKDGINLDHLEYRRVGYYIFSNFFPPIFTAQVCVIPSLVSGTKENLGDQHLLVQTQPHIFRTTVSFLQTCDFNVFTGHVEIVPLVVRKVCT